MIHAKRVCNEKLKHENYLLARNILRNENPVSDDHANRLPFQLQDVRKILRMARTHATRVPRQVTIHKYGSDRTSSIIDFRTNFSRSFLTRDTFNTLAESLSWLGKMEHPCKRSKILGRDSYAKEML